MDPITHYEFGKARHRELEAEFRQYWGRPDKKVDERGLSGRNSLILGAGSLLVGMLLVALTLLS